MVIATDGRTDLDNEILIKPIIYRKIDFESTNDLTTDEPSSNPTYQDYSILVQCTVQRADSKYVQDGILQEGDMIGVFRFEYVKDSDGEIINPKLIPKTKDKIKFVGQWFSIRECTPVTGEDLGVICWEFTAAQTGLKDYEVN